MSPSDHQYICGHYSYKKGTQSTSVHRTTKTFMDPSSIRRRSSCYLSIRLSRWTLALQEGEAAAICPSGYQYTDGH